ncbi:hypothetical protein OAH77_04575 [Flavobacteriaceae bacterium]|nr:hypothetical protein [Flavobacteriaceae bacterium]
MSLKLERKQLKELINEAIESNIKTGFNYAVCYCQRSNKWLTCCTVFINDGYNKLLPLVRLESDISLNVDSYIQFIMKAHFKIFAVEYRIKLRFHYYGMILSYSPTK